MSSLSSDKASLVLAIDDGTAKFHEAKSNAAKGRALQYAASIAMGVQDNIAT